MSVKDWLEVITVETLLELAPDGFMIGCGGTSAYLAHAFRTRPSTEADLFQINRQGDFFDSLMNEQTFALADLSSALQEIDKRLGLDGYVRVSFDDGREEFESYETNQALPSNILKSFLNVLKNPPPTKLFDHSFLLVKSDDILRFESYIDQYGPRVVVWNDYRNDLEELVVRPSQLWERIFGVLCTSEYNLAKVTIIVTS